MAKGIGLAAWSLLAVIGGAIIFFSSRPSYMFHGADEATLIVSFKRNTELLHQCSDEEVKAYQVGDQRRRPHMRKRDGSCGGREKTPLSLWVTVDGVVKVEKRYDPSGFRNDGSVHVYEAIMTRPGQRTIGVTMQDSPQDDGVEQRWQETVDIAPRQIVLVDYDEGFHIGAGRSSDSR